MDIVELIVSQTRASGGSSADALFQRLQELILSGQIPAGFVFPKEPVFCEQLGVSRSTLREAYKALESTGFIRRVKRLGTIVNDSHNITRQAPLSASLILSDLDELLEFRIMIEAELARLAAKRARPENLAVMTDSLEKMRHCNDNIQELTDYDTMFHMEIAKASGNHLLISTMENARGAFNKGIYQAFQVDTQKNVAEALLFHERILDAIARQEPEEAYALMRQHIRTVGCRIEKRQTPNPRELPCNFEKSDLQG